MRLSDLSNFFGRVEECPLVKRKIAPRTEKLNGVSEENGLRLSNIN